MLKKGKKVRRYPHWKTFHFEIHRLCNKYNQKICLQNMTICLLNQLNELNLIYFDTFNHKKVQNGVYPIYYRQTQCCFANGLLYYRFEFYSFLQFLDLVHGKSQIHNLDLYSAATFVE